MEEMTPSEGRKKGRKETNIDVNWGLDLDMSPWKSGGAVSYDERFCLREATKNNWYFLGIFPK